MERVLGFMLSEEVQASYCLAYENLEGTSQYTRILRDDGDSEKKTVDFDGSVLRITRGSFRWREGKIAKENERAKKQKALESTQEQIEKGGHADAERAGLDDKRDALKQSIAELDVAIKSCGESALLPATGPPTIRSIDMTIKKGTINLVVRPVGCGKAITI